MTRTVYLPATLEKETVQNCGRLTTERGHAFSFSAAVAEGLRLWNERIKTHKPTK